MIPLINIEEIRKQHGNYFDQPFYDIVVEICKIYFPRSTKIDTNNSCIIIKDCISLTLSLSSNESKIYFYSFAFTNNRETNSLLHSACRTFRLFSLVEVAAYLQLKAQENELIRYIEG